MGPGVATPVLSARRAPGVVAQLVADRRLRAGLDAVLAGAGLGPAAEQSCVVVGQGARPILARRADTPLVPASTLKVLTAHAVLARLGPDERLATDVRVVGGVPPGGEVAGDLWLVGGGDPLLATADYVATFANQPQVFTALEGLADAVVAAGVTAVRGAVVGDESRYDAVRYVPTWKPSYRTDGDVGPAGALVVNDGFIQVRPRPIPAERPATHAAGVFAGLLAARGVAVDGPARDGAAPPGSLVVATVPSQPVAAMVGEMLRESDNLTAELLLKELGVRFGGAGSTASGLPVVRQALEEAGLPSGPLAAADASGLDRSDRATCSLLAATLAGAPATGPLVAGLPVAGRDGTLRPRFRGHPAEGRLRAKTGSLTGVVGLAGFLDAPPARAGRPALRFALLANQLPRDSVGRQLQEDVAAVLARYPEAPDLAGVGPGPGGR